MTDTREELKPWLRMARVPGLGPVLARRLLERFKSPERVFAASSSELAAVEGVGARLVRELLDPRHGLEAEHDFEVCEKEGVQVIPLTSSSYPPLLREIPSPPPVLFVKGELLQDEDEIMVAVVGCRNPDPYGESMAAALGSGLARLGFTVVSGMARGIDSMAQRAALKAGGRSVAVLGSGVDVVYPPEHESLYRALCQKGAVVSEFPPGTRPDPGHFPRRNRIISGLCRGVVMVQAMSEKSGALITVRHALEQGREVYAVPGNAGSRGGRVGNLLIKQGAKLVESAEDVAADLLPLGSLPLFGKEKPERKSESKTGLPDPQARVYSLVPAPNEGTIDIDTLARQAGMSAGEVLSNLLELELSGLVKSLPGKRYVRIADS